MATTVQDVTKADAQFILQQTVLGYDNTIMLPIDPVQIANALGIDMREGTFLKPGVKAVAVHNPHTNKSRITVSAELPLFQKRIVAVQAVRSIVMQFRGAHDGMIIKNISSGTLDEFSAEILMPRTLVLVKYAEGHSLKKMAKMFEVTEDVLVYRLVQLGIK